MRNFILFSNPRFWHRKILAGSECRICWMCQCGSSFRCSGLEQFSCFVGSRKKDFNISGEIEPRLSPDGIKLLVRPISCFTDADGE